MTGGGVKSEYYFKRNQQVCSSINKTIASLRHVQRCLQRFFNSPPPPPPPPPSSFDICHSRENAKSFLILSLNNKRSLFRLSIHCRISPSNRVFHRLLSSAFLFYVFPLSLLCRFAILCMVDTTRSIDKIYDKSNNKKDMR